jgi:hypothetical protein
VPSARPRLGARLARGAAWLALAGAFALALAIGFFPFARLAPALGARIQRETGVAAQIGALRARLSALGPVLEASDVTLRWPSGEVVSLGRVAVRAARPGAWLRGVPTAHVRADSSFGTLEADLSRELASGEVAGLDLARLPAPWLGRGGSAFDGPLTVRFELTRPARAWGGNVALAGSAGSLALPGWPVAIPYDRVAGSARLDERGTLHVDSLALTGPMLTAHAAGTIGGPAGRGTGAVALGIDLERVDPALLPSLAQSGVALDAEGKGRLSLTGTLAEPVLE